MDVPAPTQTLPARPEETTPLLKHNHTQQDGAAIEFLHGVDDCKASDVGVSGGGGEFRREPSFGLLRAEAVMAAGDYENYLALKKGERPPKPPRPHDLSWTGRKISEILQRYPYLTDNLEAIFRLLLQNVLMCCVAILIFKGYDDACFYRWTNGKMSVLGNWNLQLADCMLILSYSIKNYLNLRLCLAVACTCFVVYAITSPIGIMLDMLVFNFSMILLNLSHAIMLIYEKRHIDFEPEFEQIYCNLFATYMSRPLFKRLVKIALVREEKCGTVMKRDGDLVTSLCIIIRGTVLVKRGGKVVNTLTSNEFIEAPEWVRSNLNPEDTRLNLTFVTQGSVTYVKWSRETLVTVIQKYPEIKHAVLAVLGIKTAELWLRSVRRNPGSKEMSVDSRGRKSSGGSQENGAANPLPRSRSASGNSW